MRRRASTTSCSPAPTCRFYDVPAHVAEHIYEERGVRTAAWRGIGAGYTNFAIEVVIDELARSAGQNPLEYRLALLKDPRAKKVVETAAQHGRMEAQARRHARSASRSASSGCRRSASRWSGTVAEVSRRPQRAAQIKVHNLWCAADVGLPVQPGNVVAQLEGSLIFALGSALKERITIKDGQVEQIELPRLRDPAACPRSRRSRWRSSAAATCRCRSASSACAGTAPAVANAFLAMTGQTLRAMPFTPQRVRNALARS